MSAYQLGATLYVPATRIDLDEILSQKKFLNLRSLAICLEDSVPAHQVVQALENLQHLCTQTDRNSINLPLIFIRPRHLEMAKYLVDHLGLGYVTGFILPKFNLHNALEWQKILERTNLLVMPTLETVDCFDSDKMSKLANSLLQNHFFAKSIVALRVGGNDLLRILGLRRSKTGTLYDTPLGYVMKMLICQFKPHGFSLTAPVCELIHQTDILQEELIQDINHGFFGKTAIHPLQIPIIQGAYQVDTVLFQEAKHILNSQEAVFKLNGAMCEPATHVAWAQQIMIQAHVNGVR